MGRQIMTYKQALYIRLARCNLATYIQLIPEQLVVARISLMWDRYYAKVAYENPEFDCALEKLYRLFKSLKNPERR